MSEFLEKHHLDVDFETARAIHRIVRAMHDGECPRCHELFESYQMRRSSTTEEAPRYNTTMQCPRCGFTITGTQSDAAIEAFGPVMERNLEVFENWRKNVK